MDKERLLEIIIIHTNLIRKVVRKVCKYVSSVHWYRRTTTKGKVHEVKSTRIVTAKNPEN